MLKGGDVVDTVKGVPRRIPALFYVCQILRGTPLTVSTTSSTFRFPAHLEFFSGLLHCPFNDADLLMVVVRERERVARQRRRVVEGSQIVKQKDLILV